MKNTDITIVGSGFAGLSCARKAAAHGMKTVVLERKACPEDHIRTTGILVKEAADLLHLPSHLGKPIRCVRLYAPNGKWIDLESPGYAFVATDTPGMMRWLAQNAQVAGAEIRTSTNATRFQYGSNDIELTEIGLRTRYLVGCDGARSNVARAFQLGQNREFLLGSETEYEGVRGLAEDRLHVFLDSQLAPGYIGWVVPGMGITQVGIAVRKPHRPQLKAFEEKMRQIFDFSRAKVVGKRGGLIPCGGVLKHWHTDRVMLLGDAAGMVSPLTAGGIYPSLEIGAKAGEVISHHLMGSLSDPAAEIDKMVPRYRTKNWLRWSMDHVSPPNLVYNWVLGNPVFQRVAQILFFHHRGLFCTQAWKEILGMKYVNPEAGS